MKKIFLVFISIFVISCATNKTAVQRSQISVLGTIHFPNEKVNADSIFNIIQNFKPDFILIEIDSSKMNEDFTFKNLYNENEIIAVVRYKMNYPDVNLRPIEMNGRDTLRKKSGLYSEASLVFQNLNKLNNENGFSESEKQIWNQFSNYWELSEEISNQNLIEINTEKSDLIIDSLMSYQYSHLRKIVDNNVLFSKNGMVDAKNDTIKLKEYFNKWADFELKRNSVLGKNALKIINQNPQKRILILVGFKHRFAVRKFLIQNNVQISEYYQ